MMARQVNSVGYDQRLEAGEEAGQGLGVSLGDRQHCVCLATDLALEAPQATPLDQGVEGCGPASGVAPVSLKVPSLQQILGVVIIEDKGWSPMAPSILRTWLHELFPVAFIEPAILGRPTAIHPSSDHQSVGGEFDALDLDDVELLRVHQFA
ncbi:hypothetical protein ES703_71058 [subsurface metagenome]